jgi:hypothetical protein
MSAGRNDRVTAVIPEDHVGRFIAGRGEECPELPVDPIRIMYRLGQAPAALT